jgi:hypothetical protein
MVRLGLDWKGACNANPEIDGIPKRLRKTC